MLQGKSKHKFIISKDIGTNKWESDSVNLSIVGGKWIPSFGRPYSIDFFVSGESEKVAAGKVLEANIWSQKVSKFMFHELATRD